jgi:hypothetical protein
MQSDGQQEQGTAQVRPNETSIPPKGSVLKPKVYSRYPLPSERYPFSIHFDILARFATHSRNGTEPISADRVEGSGVPKQSAQMNVRFLASIGLLRLESKGLYLPTPEAIRLVNARTVSDERARPILRAVIQNSWFAEVAVTALKSAPLVDEDALVGELALAAETNREKKGQALRVLVEYLLWSGVIRKDERGLVVTDGLPALASTSESGPTPVKESVSAGDVAPAARSAPLAGSTSAGGIWHIVQTEDYFLKIRSDPIVLEELRDQLELIGRKINRLRVNSSKPTAGGEDAGIPDLS